MSYRYVALADLHLLFNNPVCRMDNLVAVQWEKLTYVFEYAANREAHVLIAGDIHVTSNNYSLLNQLIQFLREYRSRGVRVFCVYGQHDLKYRNPDDTNLQILINSGYVEQLGDKPVSFHVNKDVHHRLWGSSWMSPIPSMQDKAPTDILVIHDSISPAKIYPGQQNTDAKKFLKTYPSFDIVICGDIHRTFIEENQGRTIVNPGPLLRREADEYNMVHRPGFFYFDLDKAHVEFVVVPHEPSSKVITRQHIEKKKAKEQTAARADTSQFLSELRARTADKQVVNIRDRIRARIEEPDGSTQQPVIGVMEHLLNGKTVEQYIKEKTQ